MSAASRIIALEKQVAALAAEVARLADRVDGKDVHDEIIGPQEPPAWEFQEDRPRRRKAAT